MSDDDDDDMSGTLSEQDSSAYDYDEDFGGNGGTILDPASPSAGGEQRVTVVTVDELEESCTIDVKKVMDTTGLSEVDAWRALRVFDWDVVKLTGAWFEDTVRTREKLNLCESTDVVMADDETVTCPVCYTDAAAEHMLHAGCGHRVCKDCWAHYLAAWVKDMSHVTHLTCAGNGACKVVTPLSLLRQVANAEQADVLAGYERSMLVDSNPRATWCTQPGCERVAVCTGRPPKPPTPLNVACGCGGMFCFTCKAEAHRPVDCKTVENWAIKNSNESENLTWILANTKPCPNCRSNIQKNQGCMHMTCFKCRHEFCWLCCGEWAKHGSDTGGYYACNRYETEKEKEAFSADEARRQRARTVLERYTHHYERYHAHAQAQARTASEQEGALKEAMKNIEESTRIPESHLSFMLDASEQIVECRRILKWTYAYSFYKFDTFDLPIAVGDGITAAAVKAAAIEIEAINKRKSFFEFLQNDAESALEQLSKALEVDMKRFHHADDFWRQVNHHGPRAEDMDDHEFMAAEFARLQAVIVNLTQVSKRFFDKLVDQLEMGLDGMEQQFAAAPVAAAS